MRSKLLRSLLGSTAVTVYILLGDYLYGHGHIALDSYIYEVDLYLLYPSYFIVALLCGWNSALFGDVPNSVFIILSFFIYFAFFYLLQGVIVHLRKRPRSHAQGGDT